jgi:hypothetical protein
MIGVFFGLSISLYGQLQPTQTQDVLVAATNPATTQTSTQPARKKKPKKIKVFSLTRMKPLAANVGFDQFRVNDSPEHQSPIVDGKDCKAFLFAHADSTLLYTLPKWARSFSAVGFSFESKDVKFLVRCDGKNLYESSLLAQCPDQLARIDIDLPADAQQLELIARGVPNNGHAFTTWCNPMLYSGNIEERKLFEKEELEKEEQANNFSPRYGLEIKEEGCLALGLPNNIFSSREVTYEAWVWPATWKQTGHIIYDGDDHYGHDREIMFSNGSILLKGIADPPMDIVSKDQLRPDAWNYVALTIAGDQAILYLNGKKTAEYKGRIADVAGCSALYLGRGVFEGRYWGQQYRGLITDARLWNRDLSSKEINSAYHKKFVNSKGLIGRWSFEKGEPNSKVCKYQNSAAIGDAKIISLKTLPKSAK